MSEFKSIIDSDVWRDIFDQSNLKERHLMPLRLLIENLEYKLKNSISYRDALAMMRSSRERIVSAMICSVDK
jgi:hypothetical protein